MRVLGKFLLELGKLFRAVFHLDFAPGTRLDQICLLVPEVKNLISHFGKFTCQGLIIAILTQVRDLLGFLANLVWDQVIGRRFISLSKGILAMQVSPALIV